MTKKSTESLTDLEGKLSRNENTARLSVRYGLPRDVAQRIVEMSANIDQACSIAELMR